MNNEQLINELIALANDFDSRHMTKEADTLTLVAQRIAQVGPWEDYQDAYRGDKWEMGEDQYDSEQMALQEMNENPLQSDPMGLQEAHQIIQSLMPRSRELSPQEQEMLNHAMEVAHEQGTASGRLSPDDFQSQLEEAGAVVN